MIRPFLTALCALAIVFPSSSAPILLVRGTVSTPNAAERNYAASTTRRLGRWLSDLDVVHSVVNDEDIIPSVPPGVHLLVLGYNPYPPPDQIKALAAFVRRGGKVIVFYSAEPALARLMKVKLGDYKTRGRIPGWCAVRFNESAPPHVPRRVLQRSRNIRPVYPRRGESTVIAHWESGDGQLLDDPAWVRSEHGFWMTHVLLDDGDTWNKKQMLLGILAVHVPSVWRSAAERQIRTVGRLGRFPDFSTAVQQLMRRGYGTPREPQLRALLSRAARQHQELDRLAGKQRYADVVENTRAIEALLLRAYGTAQRPRPGEFRGVWDHSGSGLYTGDWKRTCAFLAGHGVTDILTNVAWPGLAHYDSRVLARSDVVRRHGDQLAQALEAARGEGLRVHVWKVCWNLDAAPPRLVRKMKKQGRTQVSDTGESLEWLCPSHPENRRLEKDSIREIVKQYAVDGIHLDYIRYPSSHACYCAGCRRRFEAHLGRELARWPADVLSGILKLKYRQWRRKQITSLVHDVRVLTRAVNPDIRISAAVFGKYPLCRESVAQDWGDWLRQDFVDFVCPMNYTTDMETFTSLTRSQVALPAARARVIPGIGVTAAESRLDPAQVIDQVNALREAGVPGFVLFDLNPVLETETLPILRLGISSE